jgi:hypothetical protein
MTTPVGIVKIPYRFEALRDLVGRTRLAQVLIEATDDVLAAKKVLAEVRSAGQGKLLFLLGQAGSGKTSLAESLPIYVSELVAAVITPPPDYELPLADLSRWLSKELGTARPGAKNRIIVANLDGREIPPSDETATQGAMVNLNALLRRQPNTLAVWPVNSEAFARSTIDRLTSAGGQSALASEAILQVKGLPSERFFDALQLILTTLSLRLDDAAVSVSEAQDLADQCATVGQYLEEVHRLVADRYDVSGLGTKLPRLFITITSSADTTPSCRLLRRGNQFLVDPDRLLQVSRANIAEDWRRRARQDSRRSLAFVSSLLEVKLTNLSASAVVNACAFAEDEELREVVAPSRPAASKEIQAAYKALQSLTNRKHRAINEAIVRVLTGQLDLTLPGLTFEHCPFSNRDLRIDAWYEPAERPVALEFTHQRPTEAGEASIASYVLNKVQDYARDYQLI